MSMSAASSSGVQRCCMHSALQLPHDWLVACRVRAFSHACAFTSEWCSPFSVATAFLRYSRGHAFPPTPTKLLDILIMFLAIRVWAGMPYGQSQAFPSLIMARYLPKRG